MRVMTNVPARRIVSLVATFVVICLVLLLLDRRSLLDPIRDGLGEVLSPVTSTFEDVMAPGSGGTGLEVAYATVVAERNELAAENARLTAELEELEALREQNKAEQQRPDITFVGAEVTGRDPTGTQEFIMINRGSKDGLREGMAVVNPYIYIGQVTEVQEHRARVVLITDPHASVGAMLHDVRADGVIYGTRGNLLVLRHVDKDVAPGKMEWVVTSDLAESETAQIPANIPIGVVVGEPVLNAQSDQLEITVQPGADLKNLTNVWIAVPNE
jgi:rod shape-determining protein MreC